MTPGLVSLVGAGPGDPGLLTLRAAERLSEADVVVYDALVLPETLNLASPLARRIFMGKRAGMKCAPQGRVNRLLVTLSRMGRRVVRLKGGDPFLFGRGGEEAEALAKAGLPWEVVPGVSSALAAPALAGIPVTHRGVSASVTIAAAHRCAGHETDWEKAEPGGTLVLLMGLSELPELCERLVARGWPASTPAAVLSSMSWPDESSVFSDLKDLAAAVREKGARPPAVIVVGEVVALRERLLAESAPSAGRVYA